LETLVVLGANAAEISGSIGDLQVETLLNEDWELGMSTSIKKGLEHLLVLDPGLRAVILLLCDQPFVTKNTISRLVETRRASGKLIVASEYSDTFGTPALFSREVFKELLALTGDRGAKNLINDKKNKNVSFIASPEAAFDIDTKEDLAGLTGA
ncbi:MAG: nucleotidyltransferase family protein, partial [Pyrinomonadaceae bacterium]|nr:nucleotidyltransferase family protein [Pyrinomonadaceae bacterium]